MLAEDNIWTSHTPLFFPPVDFVFDFVSVMDAGREPW